MCTLFELIKGAYQNVTPVKQGHVGALSARKSFRGMLGVDNNLFTYICVKALGTSSPKIDQCISHVILVFRYEPL